MKNQIERFLNLANIRQTLQDGDQINSIKLIGNSSKNEPKEEEQEASDHTKFFTKNVMLFPRDYSLN